MPSGRTMMASRPSKVQHNISYCRTEQSLTGGNNGQPPLESHPGYDAERSDEHLFPPGLRCRPRGGLLGQRLQLRELGLIRRARLGVVLGQSRWGGVRIRLRFSPLGHPSLEGFGFALQRVHLILQFFSRHDSPCSQLPRSRALRRRRRLGRWRRRGGRARRRGLRGGPGLRCLLGGLLGGLRRSFLLPSFLLTLETTRLRSPSRCRRSCGGPSPQRAGAGVGVFADECREHLIHAMLQRLGSLLKAIYENLAQTTDLSDAPHKSLVSSGFCGSSSTWRGAIRGNGGSSCQRRELLQSSGCKNSGSSDGLALMPQRPSHLLHGLLKGLSAPLQLVGCSSVQLLPML
mmetsp:Transcript_85719/g.246036  ORF Transcript_85719/g.246036 Transcript_85719/m.246036 type:complete len:346 (-) Transcript_85719:757-1794(-)